MFNADQRAYMDDLASMPPDEVCWCGWYPRGQCATPTPCDPSKSAADKLAVRCPDPRCRAADAPAGWPGHRGYVIHTIGCRLDRGALIASNLAAAYRPKGVP